MDWPASPNRLHDVTRTARDGPRRTGQAPSAAGGAEFGYHGDFDWGGIRIASKVRHRVSWVSGLTGLLCAACLNWSVGGAHWNCGPCSEPGNECPVL